MEAIRDEYPKSPILLFTATSHPTQGVSDFSDLNQALGLVETAKLGCTSIALDPKLALGSVAKLKSLGAVDKFWASSYAISIAIDAALSATKAVKAYSSMEAICQTLNSRGSTFHSELFCRTGVLGDEGLLKPLSYSPSHRELQVFGSFTTSRGRSFMESEPCSLTCRSVEYSTPLLLPFWLGSKNQLDAKGSIQSEASLRTTSLPYILFSDLSQLRHILSHPSMLANCPDLSDLKQSLFYDLTNLSQNYASIAP